MYVGEYSMLLYTIIILACNPPSKPRGVMIYTNPYPSNNNNMSLHMITPK